MLSTKVVEDEYELRYYKGYINTTIFYESLISTWQATIAAEVAKFKETSNENDKTTELLENDVNSDEIACKDILQKVMIGIEPMIRSYLEIPKNIDTNHMGSENYESLKEEVANLELELRRQKVYTALLNQRLEEIMVAAKLAEKISHLFITESDKINDKTFTLHELDALMAMIKSGEDVLERLLPLEKKTTSYHLYSEIKHEN